MRRFVGRNAVLYAFGDVYQFTNVGLEDCGTGWDWRLPEAFRCWLPGSLSFEVLDGEWRPVGAVELHRPGRVGFDRCFRGLEVRAKGSCCPLSVEGVGAEWELNVEAVVRNASSLGEEAALHVTRPLGALAIVKGAICRQESVYVWLPSGDGAFVGTGRTEQVNGHVNVKFDDEGVSYGYC